MGRPRQHSDEEILKVARECFLEHGPAASTVEVARHLGISQAALFKRFGSKSNLLWKALAPPEIPPWLPLVEAGPDDRDGDEQLRELAGEISRFFAELVPCFSVLRAAGVEFPEALHRYTIPPPVRAFRAMRAWFARAREKGVVGPVDPDAAALSWLGSLAFRHFVGHILPGLVPDPQKHPPRLDQLVSVVWTGLAPKDDR